MNIKKKYIHGELVEHTINGVSQLQGVVSPHQLLDRHPIEPEVWPAWALVLKSFAIPDDGGIGDVVHRLIGDENSTKFKMWYKLVFNTDCGCDGRLARWNRKYPLGGEK